MEFEIQQLSVNNKRNTQELDDARIQLENELLLKSTLETKFRNTQLDLESTSAQLEEESEAKLLLQKQCNKLQDEIKLSRERAEKDCQVRIDEIEDSK